ncbi:heat shock transcription factor, Y-linked-like [Electrophorus electricus]|uniref:heat shock transcription factor, Y-linked-like n=1 Tax=Electrophorus electricus TaxID=8005 RepID=UPI0015D0B5E2|nr:heat shock transcription factor, Y-linked-like [Electrophorus electricus]
MSDLTERKANTMASHGEPETDVCHGAETSATQGAASRKRTFSRSASPCALSLHNIDEASDGELRIDLEEKAFQVLAQKSVIKKPRVEVLGDGEAPFELNFAGLSFPRKLWHIVENETYKSIGWDAQGMCVVIDAELFVNEILRKEGDSKIFQTTNMKNVLRQLNLYGFKKMGRVCNTSNVARESTSKVNIHLTLIKSL